MTELIIIKTMLLFFSIFMVAFFEGLETAVTSLSSLSLNKLKKKSESFVRYAVLWETKPNEVLSAILIGTNLAIIASGVLATSIGLTLEKLYPQYGNYLLAGVPLVSGAVVLAFGEIIPKIYSRYAYETVSYKGLPCLFFMNKVFDPANRFVLMVAEHIIGRFSKNLVYETPFLRHDELKVLLLADESLSLSARERKMVSKIFDLGKTRVEHIMVPREQMQAVNIDGKPKDILNAIIDKGYSRIPVYKHDLDNIVGIIYSKDLNLSLRGETLFLIEDLVRPAYFIPESARVDKILKEFKTGHQHMAIVVNEFGSTVGLVTIEDIVEEIVGEIWDEYDLQAKTIFPLPDGFYLVKASEPLEKVNDEIKINLPSAEFNSLGGWVLDVFGKIPKAGECLKIGDVEVCIAEATKKKVIKVKLRKL